MTPILSRLSVLGGGGNGGFGFGRKKAGDSGPNFTFNILTAPGPSGESGTVVDLRTQTDDAYVFTAAGGTYTIQAQTTFPVNAGLLAAEVAEAAVVAATPVVVEMAAVRLRPSMALNWSRSCWWWIWWSWW